MTSRMTSEIIYRRGEVVYANLPIVTGSGHKRRPAVIISSDEYNAELHQVIVSGTTRIADFLPFGHCRLTDWESAGFHRPSAVTPWPATVRKDKLLGRYGQVSDRDLAAIDDSLRFILRLNPDLLGLDS